MVTIGACLFGKYPRSDSTWEAIKKHQAEPNEANRSILEKAYREDTESLLRLQKEAGLSPVIDGSLAWDDLLTPYTRSLAGVRVGGLERWYETNTFYYVPIVTGEVSSREPILTKYLLRGNLSSQGHPWAVTLLSPFTFSRLAKNMHYRSTEELMFEVAEIQSRDLEALADDGCSQVQIVETEPAVSESLGLPLGRDEIEHWKEAIRVLLKKTTTPAALFSCYGNASRLVDYLLDFPVSLLGFDLARTPSTALTERRITKGLLLGALYTDISLPGNILDEEPKTIAEQTRKIIDSQPDSNIVYLTPNHELSSVATRKEADQRIRNLARAAQMLEQVILQP